MRLRLGIALFLCVFALLPHSVHAQDAPQPDKGFVVTPARDYATVTPGVAINKKLTLANNTDKPLLVVLSIQQFTVSDYAYDYRFEDVRDDWLKLGITQVQIEPGKSANIDYAIVPPANATPGGHYFSIFATATVAGDPSKGQVQAASVLYLTVNGNLQISSTIQSVSIPRITFGDFNYTMDVKDTGNTHFFIYVSGGLSGFAPGRSDQSTHLLLPQTVRQVGGTIAAPTLPGIYTATYGYVIDTGQTVQRTSLIIYIPPWSVLVAVGLIWIVVIAIRKMRRRSLKF